MTDVIIYGEQKTYVDNNLRRNMDDMKEDIKKDDDVVISIDGKERIGKSVHAMLMGWYLSNGTLRLDQICLTPTEFVNAIKESKPNDVIIFDECFLGLASEDWQNSFNKLIKKMLVTVGQKNLALIMVLPSIFDLSKYVAIHRSDCLIHCFKHKGKRGHFAFYNQRNLQKLYIHGKKFYSYYKPKPNFVGRFTNFYPVNEEEYRLKKAESLNELLSKDESKDIGQRTLMFYKALQLLKDETGWTNKSMAEKIGSHVNTIQRAVTPTKPSNTL